MSMRKQSSSASRENSLHFLEEEEDSQVVTVMWWWRSSAGGKSRLLETVVVSWPPLAVREGWKEGLSISLLPRNLPFYQNGRGESMRGTFGRKWSLKFSKRQKFICRSLTVRIPPLQSVELRCWGCSTFSGVSLIQVRATVIIVARRAGVAEEIEKRRERERDIHNSFAAGKTGERDPWRR